VHEHHPCRDRSRRHFAAYWLDNNLGLRLNQFGVRGQSYFTDWADFAERHTRQGKAIQTWTRTP
jgi:hypothetical protein